MDIGIIVCLIVAVLALAVFIVIACKWPRWDDDYDPLETSIRPRKGKRL